MEGEPKLSKRSFLHFFDWNGKSRKELLLDYSDQPGPKPRQGNIEGFAKSQLHGIVVDDRTPTSSNKDSSGFNCALSVTSGEECTSRGRAPGVVARLMGLDSWPASNAPEPSSTASVSALSLRASYYGLRCSQDSSETRSGKVHMQPIERVQMEILPPKLAKSVPVTHHKLLSPIRSLAFITKENGREAASKMIEVRPKATRNGKMPSIGLPSAPLRTQEFKQKLEAGNSASRSRRSNDLFAKKNTKGQQCDGRSSGSEGISSCKASTSETGTSDSTRNKGKPVSQAAYMRSNDRRREAATSRNSNIKKKMEQREISSDLPLQGLPNTRKIKKRTENRTNTVLGRQNQNQNCQSSKKSSTSRNVSSNRASRKAHNASGSVGQSTTVNGDASRPEISKKIHMMVTVPEKQQPMSIPSMKGPVNGELQFRSTGAVNASLNRDNKFIKCKITVDGCTNTPPDNRKNDINAVSFVFTSPVTKATTNARPSMTGKINSTEIDLFGRIDHPYFNESTSSLRELANEVEPSQSYMIENESCANSTASLQNSKFKCYASGTITVQVQPARCRRVQLKDKSDHNADCLRVKNSRINDNLEEQVLQRTKEDEGYSSNSNHSGPEKDQYQHLSPISILEPSFESESSSNTNSKLSEDVTELSDSASSIFITPEINEPRVWKQDYVRYVIDNAEAMSEDYTSDLIPKGVCHSLFHRLENRANGTRRNKEEYSKLERKVLPDCVSECLELTCAQTFVGGYKSWASTCTLFETKGRLEEVVYNEILACKSMGKLMVDEVVDKDMSTRHGRWLNFDVEAFEQGLEIEKYILTCMVDELIFDLFIL